jgi:hypothetical protein
MIVDTCRRTPCGGLDFVPNGHKMVPNGSLFSLNCVLVGRSRYRDDPWTFLESQPDRGTMFRALDGAGRVVVASANGEPI